MERSGTLAERTGNAIGTLAERTWNAVERTGTLWNAVERYRNAYQKNNINPSSFFPYEAEEDSAPSGRGLRVAVEEPSCSLEFVSATEWH